jgi:hypothetical protein
MLACKLLQMAQERWRRLNGSKLPPLVRAGVRFKDGEKIEREETNENQESTERVAA